MLYSTEDFLHSLFKPGDMVHYRVFPDKKGTPFTGVKLDCKLENFHDLEPVLQKHNDAGRGIFVVINTGGNEDKAIDRINAQFMECDDLSKEDQLKNIQAFSLPPSMIVESEKSLHTYWLLKGNPDVALFRPIQKALAEHFHGDPKIVNESRVMRVPGFNHCKKDTPFPVTIREFAPEHRYTQEELIAALPEYQAPDGAVMETKPREAHEGTEKGLQVMIASCDFIQHCINDAATLPEHDWYAMITNAAGFEGGRDFIHHASEKYPGYSAEETDQKISHFLSSGTGPITCEVIAQKGWKCPHLSDHSCPCRAPAAKSFSALDTAALQKAADDIPMSKETLENIAALQDFIDDYLYNVPPATAGAILNHTIKDRFHLTVADINPLVSAQKALYRENLEKGRTRARKASIGKIPDCYAVTDKGLKFLPDVLADELAEGLPVFYAAQQFYQYSHGVYRQITELTAQKIVRSRMLKGEIKLSQIHDTTEQWKMIVEKDVRELNPNPYIINLENGMYHVLKGTLSNHSDTYYSTMQLSVNYDPSAKCPRFLQFLSETLEKDQIPLIQEMLGYCLIPVSRAQKCFVIVGEAAAGKSVLLRVVSEILLGNENVSHVSWQALNERFKPAELFGKLANVFADLPTKNIDDNGIFKALVGEDALTVERKNKDPFAFMSTARLIFSCNTIPKNYGDRSEGFYRRLIIIRYNHSIPPDKRDPDLVDKLRGEADGIFLFALAGLKRLISNDYRFSETATNAAELQKYREDSNSVLAFVKECCELDPTAEIATVEFFTRYKAYCENCGLTPFALRRVNDELLAQFSQVTKGRDTVGSRRTWKGIRVVDEEV